MHFATTAEDARHEGWVFHGAKDALCNPHVCSLEPLPRRLTPCPKCRLGGRCLVASNGDQGSGGKHLPKEGALAAYSVLPGFASGIPRVSLRRHLAFNGQTVRNFFSCNCMEDSVTVRNSAALQKVSFCWSDCSRFHQASHIMGLRPRS